jgi:hypothetical protein
MNHLSYIALFFLLKQTVYHGTGYIDRLFDWHSRDDRKLLSSYAMSAVHTAACLGYPLYNLYQNKNNFVDNFTHYDNQLYYLSTSYYIVDLFYAIVEQQTEFIIHHGLTMFIEGYLKAYRMPLLFNLSLLIAETTNPYLILWSLAKHKKYTLFGKINAFTTYSYAFIRMFCLPVFTVISYYRLCQSQELSTFNKVFVGAFAVVFNAGGFYWARGLLRGYRKWKRKQN